MGSRPATPKSDTEVDKQHTEENQTSVLMDQCGTWEWGEFPTTMSPQVATQGDTSMHTSHDMPHATLTTCESPGPLHDVRDTQVLTSEAAGPSECFILNILNVYSL